MAKCFCATHALGEYAESSNGRHECDQIVELVNLSVSVLGRHSEVKAVLHFSNMSFLLLQSLRPRKVDGGWVGWPDAEYQPPAEPINGP